MNIVRGSGQVGTESRMVRDFTEVDLAGMGTLTITQGADEGLTIEAEENLLPVLTSDVRDRRLVLGTKDGTGIRPTKPIRYDLHVKDLSAIRLSGAGDIAAAALRAERLELRTSGSGSVRIDQLKADALTARISGSGDLAVAGTTARQELTISGSGNYQAASLESSDARIVVSGNGKVAVRVADSLDVTISGAGRVDYAGAPRLTTNISGAGRVSQIGAR